MNKQKICFVVSKPGTANFLSGAMDRLKSEYVLYLVANFSDGDESIKKLPLETTKHIQIERRPQPIADLKALLQLYRYFKRNKFNVVHSYTLKASLLTAIAGWMARVPHRVRNFSGQLWCNMTGLKRKFYKMIEHTIVALDTDFVIDCNAQRQYLIDEGILKSHDQAKIMYKGSVCGIDTEKFRFNPELRKKIRKELNISSEKKVFVFLGRLRREKGIYELLEAFNQLAGENKDAFLLLVGNVEDECLEHLNEYQNIHNGENYCYYGYTKEPSYLLHAGDVSVLPSYREGFGMAVLESSCLGLPVICSDIYGMTDTVKEGITGLRFKVRDSHGLYECMKTLLLDDEMREKMGRNGHDWVSRDFPQDKVSDAWLDFYHNLDKK